MTVTRAAPQRARARARRDADYLTAQAARHVASLAWVGRPTQGHGDACLRRVSGWPSPLAPTNHRYQTCPCCGLSEARGDYCTRCRCRTGPQDWHDRAISDAQLAGIAQARAARQAQRPPQTEKSSPGRAIRGAAVSLAGDAA